jgi:hypothetical protein
VSPNAQQLIWLWAKKILPILVGALSGYAYYHYIGCVSGTCAITSNPWFSTAYGAMIGYLLVPRSKKTVKEIGND